ncbi:MAG TPA: sigma-70 family RNA polymerase sigma factor [Acidimicrobiia bacterium]|nr:sigma-70 family RNA polymerase sigma factor [Acidimicrobiia bacterium]
MTFETFFNEHYEPVRRSLAVAFGDPVLAEELAQDAFARALASWRRVSKMDHAAGWVYVVALRAGRRRPNRAQPAVTVEPVDADVADTVTRDVVLSAAIARLPERQRVALVLRYLADLPVADVAAAMGCAVGTVKSTLHAALERLGVEMQDQEEPDVAR